MTAEPGVVEQAGVAAVVLGEDALVDYDLADSDDVPIIDLVERVYAQLPPSPAARRLSRLVGSPEIEYFFKRTLFLALADFLSLAILASRPELAGYSRIVVSRRWHGSEPFAAFLSLWRNGRLQDLPGLRLPGDVAGALDRLALQAPRRLRTLARVLLTVAETWYRLLRQVRLLPRPLPKTSLLVLTYGSDFSVDIGCNRRLRNVDFVVDGVEIAPAGVAFWAERGTSEQRQRALLERGYPVLSLEQLAIGPIAFARRIVPPLVSLTLTLFGLLAHDRWWLRPTAQAGHTYLVWSEICRQVQPSAFLSVNDLLPAQVVRNIALRRNGCTSVQYQHSCHWRAGTDGWIRDYVFAFTLVDAVVTWGPAHSAHILSHRGSIPGCWEVGCIWSEHARRVSDEPELRAYYEQQLAERVSPDEFGRRVGVFDTSVGILTRDDLAAFYAGIVRLARRFPQVLFLFKPKNPIDALLADGDTPPPNLVQLPNLFETAAVVALTDLSISACFTSTLVEGMGAAKPALYYNPTGRVLHAFWMRFPGLVCGNDQELEERTSEFLWETSRERYLKHLRAHFADLEGHFDGLAITRMRTRLAAEFRRTAAG